LGPSIGRIAGFEEVRGTTTSVEEVCGKDVEGRPPMVRAGYAMDAAADGVARATRRCGGPTGGGAMQPER
jgi:hypothetical protein